MTFFLLMVCCLACSRNNKTEQVHVPQESCSGNLPSRYGISVRNKPDTVFSSVSEGSVIGRKTDTIINERDGKKFFKRKHPPVQAR